MHDFLAAIVNDDRAAVRRRLQSRPESGVARIETATLFETGIVHWIYVGDTPLHLAAAGYRVEIADALLAAGADPNAAANHRRGTPLHYASDGFSTGPAYDPARQVGMIECLIRAGAHIDAQDKNGATPLHRAVRTRAAAAVQCLLRLGCQPTLKNKSGSTPFHLAVQNTGRGGSGSAEAKSAQREIIAAFLRAGVSLKLKDGRAKTVSECATSDHVRAWLSLE